MNLSSQRLCLATVVVCALAIYIYPLALPTPLIDPDEGVHANIAQEMVERGDYFIPHLFGQTFRDKPFLYSAAQALSLREFGMNEAAVRLPGYLFALFTAITTVLIARRMFDSETALYTALASLTLVVPIILNQSPAHDVALVPWTNLIVLSFWQQQYGDPAKRWRWVALMAIFIALAFLTKGLIGVAVVGAGLGLFALVTRSISISLVIRMTIAIMGGAVLASPWYWAMEHASPGYLKYYFFERHLLGYVTDGQEHHGTPWYYYLGPAIGGSMPWFVFAAASFVQSRYDIRKRAGRPELLLACWFIGGVVFLSAAGSRLITYSLPVFPPIAILAGFGFRQYFHQEFGKLPNRLFKNNFRMAAAFGIIAPIPTLYVLNNFFGSPSPWTAYLVAGLASVAMAIGCVAFERRAERFGLAIGMLWFPLIVICLMTWPVQKLAEENSQRSLAALVTAAHVPPQEIVLVGQRVGSLWFYLPAEKKADFARGRVHEVQFSEIPEYLPPPAGVLFAATGKELKRRKWDSVMAKLRPRTAGGYCVIQGDAVGPSVASRPESSYQ